jgi:hypothetical protein
MAAATPSGAAISAPQERNKLAAVAAANQRVTLIAHQIAEARHQLMLLQPEIQRHRPSQGVYPLVSSPRPNPHTHTQNYLANEANLIATQTFFLEKEIY